MPRYRVGSGKIVAMDPVAQVMWRTTHSTHYYHLTWPAKPHARGREFAPGPALPDKPTLGKRRVRRNERQVRSLIFLLLLLPSSVGMSTSWRKIHALSWHTVRPWNELRHSTPWRNAASLRQGSDVPSCFNQRASMHQELKKGWGKKRKDEKK